MRATAVVGLAARGYAAEGETAASIEGIVRDGSEIAKEALAHAITYQPDGDFEDVLIRLAQDPSSLVRTAAARAMAKGDVNLLLAGTGQGLSLGFAFGAFKIQPR